MSRTPTANAHAARTGARAGSAPWPPVHRRGRPGIGRRARCRRPGVRRRRRVRRLRRQPDGRGGDVGEPMPERYAELGITGPLRFGAESFISYGLFDSTEPTAHAWLAGTVQRSERRRVELTEQSFVVARVRSTGSRRTSACRTPEKIRSRSRPGDRGHGLPRLDRGSPRPTRVRGRRRAARPGSSPRTAVTERCGPHHGGSSGPPHS